MRKHVPALAAFASSILMISGAGTAAGAKEQTKMSAMQKEAARPFQDPAVLPIAEAIAHGDAARIRTLAATTDLAARGQDDVTLLEWAVWNEQPDALAALLDAGADPAQRGMDGETVAHMAAMARDPAYLRVLVDHKAPIDIAGARAGWTPLFRAVQDRREAQIALLIQAGADLAHTDSMGNTLLHVAANTNDAERALQLLQAGVDPNARNARGATFQAALFAGSDARLTPAARASRQQVRDWLSAHGIALQ